MVGARRALTNKGVVEEPQAKARLVAQEFATSRYRDELSAGAPGLDSARVLLSDLATSQKKSSKGAGRIGAGT